MRKTVSGPEHPDTLVTMSNLAATYQDQDRLKEAESLHLQVREIRRKVLGPQHPSTLITMANLATTYYD